MQHWAAQSVFYHIVIDRFATGKCRFDNLEAKADQQQLQDWMGGSIQGITDSLGYLQELGIDAILLTPFFTGKKYHGYWTTNFEQVDPHYGNRAQLKQLIDCAHQLGMRVIMDLPITHCHRDATINAHPAGDQHDSNPVWFCKDDSGDVLGFFGDQNLPELDLDQPALRRYLKNIIDQWLKLGFDGIRFDHAKRPSTAFWRDFTAYLRNHHPRVFLLGENWHDSGEVGSLAPFLHGELNIPLSNALRQFLRRPTQAAIKTIMAQVYDQHSLRRRGYLLPSFLDNHDMQRAAQIAQGDAAIVALGYLLQFTLPYPPILYYGSERAQQQSDDLTPGSYERDRYFREPMDWRNGQTLLNWIQRLIQMRRHYSNWITQGDFQVEYLDDGVLGYSYSYDASRIAIYINYVPQPRRINLTAAATATLIDYNSDCELDEQEKHLQLAACSGAIVRFDQLPVSAGKAVVECSG